MRITIKNVWGILICGAIFSGLTACSSSPSPWSAQGDDSPWKAKRDAEAENAPSDEFVTDAPMEDPVPMDDMAPMEEQAVTEGGEAWPYTPPAEEMPMEEPAMAEPVAAASTMSAANSEEWAKNLPANQYLVQLFAGRVLGNVTRYQNTHGLTDARIVKTDRDGDVIHVLVHVEPDMASAQQYVSEAEAKTGSRPWIRSVRGLQKILP